MSLPREIFKKLMPNSIVNRAKTALHNYQLKKILAYGKIDQKDFKYILQEILNIRVGDNIFVNSSLDFLYIDFNPNELIDILIEHVGKTGTIVMPAFAGISYDFLSGNHIFNVKRTPSQSGLITELFRRRPGSKRSLHPTKSVVSIGPLSDFLIKDHQEDVFPFGKQSPFYKMIQKDFLTIGLGVSTSKMSFAHCVEDELGKNFPVSVYHREIFEGKCIGRDGNKVLVPTYAHNMSKMNFNIPKYIKKYYSKKVDVKYKGRNVYSVSSKNIFQNMKMNALKGRTIYSRFSYKFNRLIS